MNPIPQNIRKALDLNPKGICVAYGQSSHICDGKITMHHAIIYAGKQLQKPWAILPLCEKGHEVNLYQDAGTYIGDEFSKWIALNRATDQELKEISKAINYTREKKRLNKLYGTWEQKYPAIGTNLITPQKTLPKPFWLPFTTQDRDMIEYCRMHLKEAEGFNYSPLQLVQMTLKEYHNGIKEIRENLGADVVH